MIQRIILDDFLAHKHTELALGPGLTVLTGPNNSGKSAIVEALRCVATNPPPRHVIRHGAKQARVEVVLEDGSSVAWVRKPNTAWYELQHPGASEPEYFRKLGRGMVPDEVRAALRLDLVDLESGMSVDVHLGDQKKPIFLLDMDGADARMAEFFAASCESAHLISMQKALQNRSREAKIRERTLRTRLAGLERGLERLADLPEITRRGVLARECGRAAQRSERELPRLERLLADGAALNADLRRSRARTEALRELPAPPALRDVVAPERLLAELGVLEAGSERAVARERATRELRTPPAPLETAALDRLATGLKGLRRGRTRAEVRAQALAPLRTVPEPASTTNLKALADGINSLSKRIKILERRAAILDRPQPLPERFDDQPLAGLLAELRRAGQALATAREVAATRARVLEHRREELRAQLERMGSCPLCGARLEAAAFLGEPGSAATHADCGLAAAAAAGNAIADETKTPGGPGAGGAA